MIPKFNPSGVLPPYVGASSADQAGVSPYKTTMLELGKRFVEAGASFERPIMNHAVLWSVGPLTR